jgi:sugar phosphate isomerase/epimerase
MDISCFNMKDTTGYVANLELGDWRPEQVAEMLNRVGYRAISWSMPTGTFQTHGRAGIQKLIQATHDHGMTVSEINVEMDMVTLDTESRTASVTFFNQVIQAAAEVGLSTIKTYTGPIPWNPNALRIPEDISEGEAWRSVSSILRQVLPTAERYGIDLNIEAVFGHLCHDYYTLCSLFEQVESPRLGVVMDPSHLYLYDNDIPWAIRCLGDKIKHVHIKDVVGRLGPFPQSFVFPLPGEGQIAWGPFLQALKDINYRGFFTIEFESFVYYRRILRSDPERAAQLSLEHFQTLCDAIEVDDEFDGASLQTPWMK